MPTKKILGGRLLSCALAVAMVISTLSTTVFAEVTPSVTGAVGTIQSFNVLPEPFIPSVGKDAPDHIYALSLAIGTPAEDLQLPAELTATVEHTAAQDSGTATTEESVAVTWQTDNAYKPGENGTFLYTAVLTGDYTLANGVKLPQIYVAVGKQARNGITQRTTPLEISGDTQTTDNLTTEGWKWDKTTSTLTLKDANFNVSKASAILLRTDATVVMEGTNTITSIDVEAVFGGAAVTIDMAEGSNTTISSNKSAVSLNGLTVVQGDGELSVVTSSSTSDAAIYSSSNPVEIKGKSVVHAESTGTGSSAYYINDLTIQGDAVFTAKVTSEADRIGTITGSLTATGKAITCNIGGATGYTSPAVFANQTFYEGTTYSSSSVVAKDIKIANAVATETIITINNTEYKGTSLQAAIAASGVAATAITTLEITAGKVTAADWDYLRGLSALTTFEIDSEVTTVADIPDGQGYAFPESIVTVKVPQAITIGIGAFANHHALTTASFPAVTSIGLRAFNMCTELTTITLPGVQNIGGVAFYECTKLTTLKLGATPPPTVANSAFEECPTPRTLAYVDANGNDLTGTALTAAIENYKNDPTPGAVVDGKWYGWTIEPATNVFTATFDANGGNVTPATATTGADGKLVSLPTPIRSGYSFNGWFTAATGGTQITTNTIFEANTTIYAHWTQNGPNPNPTPSGGSSGGSSKSNWTPTTSANVIDVPQGSLALGTYNNYDALLVQGLEKLVEQSKGKTVNLDRVENGKVLYRVKVDPAKLATVLKADLSLNVHYVQNDANVLSVTNRFAKYYSNNIVAVTYDQAKPLSVNAEFAAKLDLSKLNSKTLYFYSYNPTTNSYTRIAAPNYFVDANGYSHITAPLGGSILITDKPLTAK